MHSKLVMAALVSFSLVRAAHAGPVVDGTVAPGEWFGPTANTTRFDDGWIATQVDAGKLYVLVDVVADDKDNGICNGRYPPRGDWLELLFDTDRNEQLGAAVDRGYRARCDAQNQIVAYRCFRCVPNDHLRVATKAELHMGFGPTPKMATPHRFWELSIPVVEFSNTPTIKAWLWYASEKPTLEATFPAEQGFTISLTSAPPSKPQGVATATSPASSRHVRVTDDGAIELKLPQVIRALNTDGTITETYPNGARMEQSAAEAVAADLPTSPAMDKWLSEHAGDLLAALKLLVNDPTSIANFKSAEANLSLQRKITKRARAIRFILTP
jgi:hypothetical protein